VSRVVALFTVAASLGLGSVELAFVGGCGDFRCVFIVCPS
jgi:hypothetical protein